MFAKWFLCALVFALLPATQAQPWVSFETHSRYLAMGDSISSGYAAVPATQGFTYQLYQSGAIDNVNHTLFCTMAVPGVLTKDVLDYQVPQAARFFSNTGSPYRQVITLTTGGNDMRQVLAGADPAVVLQNVARNLYLTLAALTSQFPAARIYVANYYDPQLPVPGERALVMALNGVIAGAAGAFPGAVNVVDLFTVFDGRSGVLLIERKGADAFEVHPTNAGYRLIADTFAGAIKN